MLVSSSELVNKLVNNPIDNGRENLHSIIGTVATSKIRINELGWQVISDKQREKTVEIDQGVKTSTGTTSS
jgi:hypothetical protein